MSEEAYLAIAGVSADLSFETVDDDEDDEGVRGAGVARRTRSGPGRGRARSRLVLALHDPPLDLLVLAALSRFVPAGETDEALRSATRIGLDDLRPAGAPGK
jgi:hypothetical protein